MAVRWHAPGHERAESCEAVKAGEDERMIFVPPPDRHYCLDPWCENPDPELIPEAACGCHILTECELEERKQKYLKSSETGADSA